jgi:cytochrome P450 / NADPH-cytochrome P450 reductase
MPLANASPALPALSIPSPPGIPLFGNLFQLPRHAITAHFTELAKQYPGVFQVHFAYIAATFVTDPALVAELADANRFRKLVGPPLSTLRTVAGDGLFTAHSEEPNWDKAHKLLTPAFGQRAMRGYFETMLPVADQLIQRWTNTAHQDIDVPDDMIRFTLETVGQCGFDFEFELFKQESMHPFTAAMTRALTESMERLTRLRLPHPIWLFKEWQLRRDSSYLHKIVDQVIAKRRAESPDKAQSKRDMLSIMLQAVDEKGQGLSDQNLRFQVLTFLIAGHETTSGLLSFALYYLVKEPGVLDAARAEIDSVLPRGTRPTFEHMAQLPVIERLIKETLRLWPTVPVYAVAPFQDTQLGPGYRVRRNAPINILLTGLHRNPLAWDRPNEFDLERFSVQNEPKITPHAYKPFGNGERACIGRQFAYTEAKLALALILQHFDLQDPYDYTLSVKETLSLKPANFRLRASARYA